MTHTSFACLRLRLTRIESDSPDSKMPDVLQCRLLSMKQLPPYRNRKHTLVLECETLTMYI
jgi:hypothetical protein